MADSRFVVLASYPKTGSTWLGKIIGNLVAEHVPSGQVLPAFSKALPESERFTVRGISYQFVKTHFHPENARFQPLEGKYDSCVSIYRHPLDVLLSSLNYAKLKEHSASFIAGRVKAVEQLIADGEMRYYIDQFIEADGFPWFEGPSGKFSLYQRRWRAQAPRIRYLEIRYEDFVSDPHRTVADVNAFLNTGADAATVDKVVKRTDAETRGDGKFFWSRRAQNFDRLLPRELSDYFCDHYRQTLDELGYR